MYEIGPTHIKPVWARLPGCDCAHTIAEPRAEAGARAGASERRPTRSAATARRGASGIKTTKDVRRKKTIDKDTVIGHTDRLFVQARGAGAAGSPGSMLGPRHVSSWRWRGERASVNRFRL